MSRDKCAVRRTRSSSTDVICQRSRPRYRTRNRAHHSSNPCTDRGCRKYIRIPILYRRAFSYPQRLLTPRAAETDSDADVVSVISPAVKVSIRFLKSTLVKRLDLVRPRLESYIIIIRLRSVWIVVIRFGRDMGRDSLMNNRTSEKLLDPRILRDLFFRVTSLPRSFTYCLYDCAKSL